MPLLTKIVYLYMNKKKLCILEIYIIYSFLATLFRVRSVLVTTERIVQAVNRNLVRLICQVSTRKKIKLNNSDH